MQKIHTSLVILLLLLGSACAAQATQPENTPTTEPAATLTQTTPPTVEIIPTETSPPAIQLDNYPQIIPSGDIFNQVVSVDPGNAERMAYCAPGEIRVSSNGGQSWDTIPTAGAASVVQESGFELFYGEPGGEDACLSVTFDPGHPESYYALFSTAAKDYGAPPLYYMGLFTPDNGLTWQMVTPPASAGVEDFGGFWNLGGDGVEALFFPAGSWSQDPQEILVTKTTNGGLEWQAADLSCPRAAACIRWGPTPSNVPGMGSPLPQSIFFSPDQGETWSVIDPPVELRVPAPNQLVMLSDTQLLIISGSINLSQESSVIRVSMDAGGNWGLLPIPSISSDPMNANYFPGLQYLPNGTYLSQGPEASNWYWLQPDNPIWCPVNTGTLPSNPVMLQYAAGQLWWVDINTQQVASIPLLDISCAVE